MFMQSKVDASVWSFIGTCKLKELRLSTGPLHLVGTMSHTQACALGVVERGMIMMIFI
jgi:hypothetical protein